MDVLAWITAVALAGPAYYVGLRAGRRMRGRQRAYLAWNAALVLVAASCVMFFSRPGVVVCFGVVFAVQLGMRHAYGPLTQLVSGDVTALDDDVSDTLVEAEPAVTSAAEAPRA